jgi:NAD-dependent SIR2 family protein deacetylase
MEFYKTYIPKLLDRSGAVRYRTLCRSCLTDGRVRPDVVLFGEGARLPASVVNAAATATFGAVVVVGTAGDVYPSSAIAQQVAQRCSCPVAVVDPAMTRLMEGSRCDMAVRGSAEQVLGEVAAEYLRGTAWRGRLR